MNALGQGHGGDGDVDGGREHPHIHMEGDGQLRMMGFHVSFPILHNAKRLENYGQVLDFCPDAKVPAKLCKHLFLANNSSQLYGVAGLAAMEAEVRKVEAR